MKDLGSGRCEFGGGGGYGVLALDFDRKGFCFVGGWCVDGVGGEGGECGDMERKRGMGWEIYIYKWKVENGGEDGSKLESISDFNRVAGLVR